MANKARVFNKTSTAYEVAAFYSDNIAGKHVIVTGGAGGLGFETARVLCRFGAVVMVTCRTDKQGIEVVEKIQKEQDSKAEISYGIMDLQSLASIKAFADSYIASGKPLNVLVANAGVMACAKEQTKDGFEMQFGVNHLGHFYLSTLLLPVLHASGSTASKSRVVSVSSLGNWLYGPPGAILWDDIGGNKYDKWQRYGQSKLANILFARSLTSYCLSNSLNVEASAVHPGVILETGLARHNTLIGMVTENLYYHWRSPTKLVAILNPFMKNVGQGAAGQVLLCCAPTFVAAGYVVDCAETNDFLHPLGKDDATASRLWTFSEELIKPFV